MVKNGTPSYARLHANGPEFQAVLNRVRAEIWGV